MIRKLGSYEINPESDRFERDIRVFLKSSNVPSVYCTLVERLVGSNSAVSKKIAKELDNAAEQSSLYSPLIVLEKKDDSDIVHALKMGYLLRGLCSMADTMTWLDIDKLISGDLTSNATTSAVIVAGEFTTEQLRAVSRYLQGRLMSPKNTLTVLFQTAEPTVVNKNAEHFKSIDEAMTRLFAWYRNYRGAMMALEFLETKTKKSD